MNRYYQCGFYILDSLTGYMYYRMYHGFTNRKAWTPIVDNTFIIDDTKSYSAKMRMNAETKTWEYSFVFPPFPIIPVYKSWKKFYAQYMLTKLEGD